MTLPATHTMSIVCGLISSVSVGFLAYLFFLRLPYRAVERINLRSPLPFHSGTNERKGESSPVVSAFLRLREGEFLMYNASSLWNELFKYSCTNSAAS